MEFQRSITVPGTFAERQIPGYYRDGKNSIRIGVSVKLLRAGSSKTKTGYPPREKLDLRARGTFFYPLGARETRTGTAVSVSGSFEMNANRIALAEGADSWNFWLVQRLAELAVDLLREDWWERFGPDAYFAPAGPSAGASEDLVPQFAAEVAKLLGTAVV